MNYVSFIYAKFQNYFKQILNKLNNKSKIFYNIFDQIYKSSLKKINYSTYF